MCQINKKYRSYEIKTNKSTSVGSFMAMKATNRNWFYGIFE